MKQRFKLQNFYKTTITSTIPAWSSDDTTEHSFSVSQVPQSAPVYVVVDFTDNEKRDIIYIHRIQDNLLYYYNYNRTNPNVEHKSWTTIQVNDVAEFFNYIFENIDDFWKIKKKTWLDIIVYWGIVRIWDSDVNISDTDISLEDNTENYIVLDYSDNTIKAVTSLDWIKWIELAVVNTSWWVITNIDDTRHVLWDILFDWNIFQINNWEVTINDWGITIDKTTWIAADNLSNVDDNVVLDKIKNVDWDWSWLDADLLDWKQASDFADASHTHSWSDIDKTWSKLSDLGDVPDYTNERYLYVDSDWNLTWAEWWWGATKFTDLTDTPDDYTDAADKYVRVNSDWTWLIFVDWTSSDDTKEVLVSSNDTTEWYLEDKIVWWANINVTTLNDWDNEQLEIAVNTTWLNADQVDWKDVDDTKSDDTVLWTAQKIWDEITNATSWKADKVTDATSWNFAWLDDTWNLTDSWYNKDSFASADHTHALWDLSNVDTSSVSDWQVLWYDASNSIWKPVDQTWGSWDDVNTRKYLWLQAFRTKPKWWASTVDISWKADKVSWATEWNFASLTSDWNLADSWHTDSDYVHIDSDETINWNKTFQNTIEIQEANWWLYLYDSNWNKYKLYVNDDWELTLDQV